MGMPFSRRVASVVSFAVTTLALLPAQTTPPILVPAIVPGSTEARVEHAAPGAVVVWFAALAVGFTPLPGGAKLKLDQPLVAGVAFADAHGNATFAIPFPLGAYGGSTLFSQAVVWDVARPIGSPDALQLSAMRRATVPTAGDIAELYVLFGQSNAEGHAQAALLPDDLRGPHPQCRMWDDAHGAFAPMQNGVNTHTYSPTTWCGPELTLGRGLAATRGTVHLVKCAFAMTALGPTPGPWNEWGIDAAELYAILRFRIDRAATALRAQGLVPRVRGVFLMQGESDATDVRWANLYPALLRDLVLGMRADLVAADLAETTAPIPFVLGAIDARLPPTVFPHVRAIRAAQRATMQLPRVDCVETSTLGLMPDAVHFDTLGVQQLGAAMAAAFARL